MQEGIQNPTPIITGKLRGVRYAVEVGPRATWHFEEILMELLSTLKATKDTVGQPTVELIAMFAGSAPGLELPPDRVDWLAETGANLVVSAVPLELGLLERQRSAQRLGRILSELSVSFRVRGDFEPDAFSKSVGIKATSSSRKDEPRRLKARVSTWRCQVGPFPLEEFPAWAIDQLLLELLPRAADIHTAVRELELETAFRFSAVCVDVCPRLNLSAAQIAGIAKLSTSLEYAMTVPREDEDFIEF